MPSYLSKVKVRRRKSKDEESITKLLKNKEKRIRLIFLLLGISLVFFGLNWPKNPPKEPENKQEQQEEENNTFSAEPVKIDSALTKQKKDTKKALQSPVRITIPDLGIDLPIKEAKVVNGYWEVFPDMAGFGLGSAYPEENGNQVIFAHAKDKLFGPLKNAKVGQNIVVFTKDKWYSYKIKEIKEVLPTQIDVIGPTENSILTLYTCSGFADSKRLIIVSEKNSA